MSGALIRITLAAIIAAAFGVAVAIAWSVWHRQPTRENLAQSGGGDVG